MKPVYIYTHRHRIQENLKSLSSLWKSSNSEMEKRAAVFTVVGNKCNPAPTSPDFDVCLCSDLFDDIQPGAGDESETQAGEETYPLITHRRHTETVGLHRNLNSCQLERQHFLFSNFGLKSWVIVAQSAHNSSLLSPLCCWPQLGVYEMCLPNSEQEEDCVKIINFVHTVCVKRKCVTWRLC